MFALGIGGASPIVANPRIGDFFVMVLVIMIFEKLVGEQIS